MDAADQINDFLQISGTFVRDAEKISANIDAEMARLDILWAKIDNASFIERVVKLLALQKMGVGENNFELHSGVATWATAHDVHNVLIILWSCAELILRQDRNSSIGLHCQELANSFQPIHRVLLALKTAQNKVSQTLCPPTPPDATILP